MMDMMTPTFWAFLNEAQFTKELLAIGVTQLYKANYATKGIFYQSFTCLSTGIERIEKLCLILDYFIVNNGMLPQENYVRKHGHQIMALFQACREIAERQKIKITFACDLNDEIHQAILRILSNFSESSGRYSNINILLGKEAGEIDCMHQWHKMVDLELYEQRIPSRKKLEIDKRATIIGTYMEQFSAIYFTTEDAIELNDPVEASRRTGIWEAVAPYWQLYMLQIILFFTQLLRELGYKAMSICPMDIPYFGEIFGLFYNDDAYFRGRKTWDKL